jgi:hypothetical protein
MRSATNWPQKNSPKALFTVIEVPRERTLKNDLGKCPSLKYLHCQKSRWYVQPGSGESFNGTISSIFCIYKKYKIQILCQKKVLSCRFSGLVFKRAEAELIQLVLGSRDLSGDRVRQLIKPKSTICASINPPSTTFSAAVTKSTFARKSPVQIRFL